MPRRVTARDGVIRKRFSEWLRGFVGDDRRVSPYKLDLALRGRSPKSDFRGAIQSYLLGIRTATAGNVYEIGRALYDLGEPTTGGAIALYAAGYFSDVVELLLNLGRTEAGAWPALAFYIALPEWLGQIRVLERFLAEAKAAGHTVSLGNEEESIREASRLAALATQDSLKLVDEAWERCNARHAQDMLTRKARLAAEFEGEDDAEFAASLAWDALFLWARNLYMECGGRLGDYPLFKPWTISDEASPPFNVITDLRPHSQLSKRRKHER